MYYYYYVVVVVAAAAAVMTLRLNLVHFLTKMQNDKNKIFRRLSLSAPSVENWGTFISITNPACIDSVTTDKH